MIFNNYYLEYGEIFEIDSDILMMPITLVQIYEYERVNWRQSKQISFIISN